MIDESIIDETDPLRIIKALSIESRYSIFLYLLIYNELTLDELSNLLGKSKSTIHHHIQELIDVSVVNEYTKAGSKTKYYKLKIFNIRPQLVKSFGLEAFKNISQEKQTQLLYDFVDISHANNYIMQNLLELLIETEENALQMINAGKQLPIEGRKDIVDHFIASQLISGNYKDEFKKDMLDLLEKYNDKEEKNPDEKKPYLFLMVGANIEEILNRKYQK
jgi:DNA-binding transcriptional ArsR family regulator